MKPEELKRLKKGSVKRKVPSSSIDAQKKPKTSNESHKKVVLSTPTQVGVISIPPL